MLSTKMRKYPLGIGALLVAGIALAGALAKSHRDATLPEASTGSLRLMSAHHPGERNQGKVQLQHAWGKLPLQFEANQGQTDKQVQFLSRGSGYNLFLAPTEAVLALSKPAAPKAKADKPSAAPEQRAKTQAAVLRLRLVGANPKPRVTGREALPGKTNYLLGNDRSKWRMGVPAYAKVHYEAVYPGIDLIYYGNQRKLEYDFVVAPGADCRRIRLAFAGADRVQVDAAGDLILHTQGGQVRQHKPLIYQEVDGIRKEIPGGYVLCEGQQVGFQVAAYDAKRPLVIDPVLVYSTYLGGSLGEQGFGIAVDDEGSAYVSGITVSPDFPTANPVQPEYRDNIDAFIAKISADGSTLLYATYLGGGGFDLVTFGLAVDKEGSAAITGQTTSTDFPTQNAVQSALGGGSDGFVTKLSADGSSLAFSTYLGGSGTDYGLDISGDAAGNTYVTGYTISSNFPLANPLQPVIAGSNDAFVTKLSADGSFGFSTYLGGSAGEIGRGIAVDKAGNVHVAGGTTSANFPVVRPLQPAFAGGSNDAWAAKMTADGSSLVYATYLGGSNSERADDIAADAHGDTYVVGETNSTNFPTRNPVQPTFAGGNFDNFVAKVTANGAALAYSTYLGGSGDEGAGIGIPIIRTSAIAVDAQGNTYLTGRTNSTDFPVVDPLQPMIGGGNDAFVSELSADGSALVYSTYLGGGDTDNGWDIAVDAKGDAYVAGNTSSPDFPTVSALQPAFGGGSDAFVTKIRIGEPAQAAPPARRAGGLLR